MIIKSFEEVEGWQKSRVMSRRFIEVIHASGGMKYDFLFIQMLKCGNSAMANVAEGFDCETDREKMRFLGIAYRSVTEFQSHLYMALDLKCLTQDEFKELYELGVQAKDKIGGFIQYLRNCIKAASKKPDKSSSS